MANPSKRSRRKKTSDAASRAPKAGDARNDLRAGQAVDGFQIEQVTPLPDLRATAIRATHRRSGARILHLFAPSDIENCFAVTFPTPPPDDTGVPHILEHAVLGGSRKFPVREPFFEMAKMSMATFINAMTSQAYTVYPVASTVKKDFFNLVEVYLDAVFQPLLTEDIFRREGHHLKLENNADLGSPLQVSGIVYSEMKGAFSMPEALMWRLAGCGLFPDTPLGHESGGDPEHIPDLTWEQFRRFHRELYHPSNGLFFIYGDIPTAEHLRFLAPALNGFERRDVRSRHAAPAALERAAAHREGLPDRPGRGRGRARLPHAQLARRRRARPGAGRRLEGALRPAALERGGAAEEGAH